jgi:protein ImuB
MYVSLMLPRFCLQAALRWREGCGAAIVVDEDSAKGVVIEADDEALRRDIHAGMSSAQAMARDMRVRILVRSESQESALNDLLVETALSLSADVELTSAGLCVADMRRRPAPACWQAFGDGMSEDFRRQGLALHVGIAPTPDLALLAAHGSSRAGIVYDAAAFVRPLSIEALAPSAELKERLRAWGVATVGELLALPRSAVIERLGEEAAALLRKVSGRHKRPLRLVRPVPRYAEAFDFEHEIETTEPLLFLLRRFLGSLSDRLRAAHLVARGMVLSIPLESGAVYERRFTIPAPTTEQEVLYRILDTHLEMLRLEQRPVGLRLEIEPSPSSGSQLNLFESALRDLNGFGETLARLKALLGEDHVGVPRKLDTYRPDAFALDDRFSEEPLQGRMAGEAEPPERGIPLRRFRPPLAAEVEMLDGMPQRVKSAMGSGAVLKHAGPYRLSGDWWDNDRWQIEEWDVELCEGGIFRLARDRDGWRVEGAYELR